MYGIPWPERCDIMLQLPLRRHLLIPTSDHSIAPELAVHGSFDEPFSAFLPTYLREGMTCVDAGASYGVFAIQMAALVGSAGFVHAFEPNPPVAAYLRRNLHLNWLAERTYVYEAALGEAEGTGVLSVPEHMHGSASMVVTDWHEPTVDVPVRVACLDDVVSGPVDLLKIDVEGYEAKVLAGARELITSGAVGCIAMEYRYDVMPPEQRAPMETALTDLSARGYRFTMPESAEELGLRQVLATHQYANLIAMKEPREEPRVEEPPADA